MCSLVRSMYSTRCRGSSRSSARMPGVRSCGTVTVFRTNSSLSGPTWPSTGKRKFVRMCVSRCLIGAGWPRIFANANDRNQMILCVFTCSGSRPGGSTVSGLGSSSRRWAMTRLGRCRHALWKTRHKAPKKQAASASRTTGTIQSQVGRIGHWPSWRRNRRCTSVGQERASPGGIVAKTDTSEQGAARKERHSAWRV